jgi:hypothetical protein
MGLKLVDALWVSLKSSLSWGIVCTAVMGAQTRSLDRVVMTALLVPSLVLPSVFAGRLMGLRTNREV